MVDLYTRKRLLILAIICVVVSFAVPYEDFPAIVYATVLFLSFHAGVFYAMNASLGMLYFFGLMDSYPEFTISGVVLTLIIASPAIGLAVFAITELSPMAFAFAAGSFIIIISTIRVLVKRFKEEQ